jgi:hypothetical protein
MFIHGVCFKAYSSCLQPLGVEYSEFGQLQHHLAWQIVTYGWHTYLQTKPAYWSYRE